MKMLPRGPLRRIEIAVVVLKVGHILDDVAFLLASSHIPDRTFLDSWALIGVALRKLAYQEESC